MSDNSIESLSWDDIPPHTGVINLMNNKLVSLPRLHKHNTCVRVKTLHLYKNELVHIESDHIPHSVVELGVPGNKLTSLNFLSGTQLTGLGLFDIPPENIECDHIPHTVAFSLTT